MNNITTAQTVISTPGRKIHQGKNFLSTDTRDISSSSLFRYGVTTGAESVHFGYTVSLELDGDALFYKDSDSTGAIQNAIFNMNETSNLTTNVQILRNVGVTTLGNLWDAQLINGGTTVFSGSRVGSRNEEFILAPNSEYILEVNNYIAALNKITILFGFYNVE
ncbi:MAG: hypothetical protein ABW166_04900 [Sedimenticola sp.]